MGSFETHGSAVFNCHQSAHFDLLKLKFLFRIFRTIRKGIKKKKLIVNYEWTDLFSLESHLHPIKPFKLSDLIYKLKY